MSLGKFQAQVNVDDCLEFASSIRHMALSTVNEDGSPHSTPLFLIFNEDLTEIYWGSHPDSLHSKNVERTRQAYTVVFDSKTANQGGLYLKLSEVSLAEDIELREALTHHNSARLRWGEKPLDVEFYLAENGQRMYQANVDQIEVYAADPNTGAVGQVIETRRKITK